MAVVALLAVSGALVGAPTPWAGAEAARPSESAGTTTSPPRATGKLRPALERQLGKGPRDFWVRFGARADLAPAARIRDWADRGTAVVARLRATAESSQATTTARLRTAHARFTSLWIDNTLYVRDGDLTLARQLAADPQVVSIREARSYAVPKPSPGRAATAAGGPEWGLTAIHADQVWSEYGATGDGIVIGSIDTGAQVDHPALARSYRGTSTDGSVSHDHHWYDPAGACTGTPSAPCDNVGHGTHTIGTMVGDDGTGNQVGVAPGARWIAAKGCENANCTDVSLALSAQWMLAPTALDGTDPDPAQRPHVLNNSWGSAAGDDWYQGFVRQWLAAGIFPAFAVGNDGPACDTQHAPGEYPESYAVGAVDRNGNVAPFSSRGSADAPEAKPDIAAPGKDVRSSVPGGVYGVMSGTSMATPHVSGAVALLWSAAPSLVGDVARTRALLDQTAHDHADTSCGGTAADNGVYGEGMLDIYAAVRAAPRRGTGTLAGTVTEAATGEPVAGATVSAAVGAGGSDPATTGTGADGRFQVHLDPGAYDVSVSHYGHDTQTLEDVPVVADSTTTRDLALVATTRATLIAQVRDGSGHNWPVYASATIEGIPGRWFTSPDTGRLAVDLPVGARYRLTVTPLYPGYPPVTQEVRVDGDVAETVPVQVDADACVAPGYAKSAAGTCAKVPGGLVHGLVTDANTDRAVDEVTVTSDDRPQDHGASAPTADDPGLADGFYWLFSSAAGAQPFTATKHGYPPAAQSVRVEADAATRADIALKAGILAMTPGKLLGQTELGSAFTRTVRLTNTGTAPVTYRFAESQQGFTVQGQPSPSSESAQPSLPKVATSSPAATGPGAPVRRVRVPSAQLSPRSDLRPDAGARTSARRGTSVAPWRDLANYPTTIRDNAAAYHRGLVYSFGGTLAGYGATKGSYVYDPAGAVWRKLADMAEGRQKPASGFVDGKFYVVGGWGPDGSPSAGTLVYDPATNRWSTAAESPHPWGAVGSAVLDGYVYSVGGCLGDCQVASADVTAYDVARNRFLTLAPYPEPISWVACGGIDGRVYCGGGLTDGPSGPVGSTRTYAYDPGTNTWTRVADLPLDVWGSSAAVANGQLLVAGGAAPSTSGLTNEVFAYQPETDTWSALPRSTNALFRGAATCGFYKIGGQNGARVMPYVEALAGWDDCEQAGTDAPWLRQTPATGTLPPGASATVTVTFDSRRVAQPGTYRATLTARENTPYASPSTTATLTAVAPAHWSKLWGHVRGTSCAGGSAPLPGATVAVDRGPGSWTLTTAADGGYVQWVPGNDLRARVVASSSGYRPASRDVTLNVPSVRADLTLVRLGC